MAAASPVVERRILERDELNTEDNEPLPLRTESSGNMYARVIEPLHCIGEGIKRRERRESIHASACATSEM
jgi:hypothetical protein